MSFSKLFNKIALKSFLFISGLSNRFSGFTFFVDKILPFSSAIDVYKRQVQQYKLLLEQSGWKLREKDGLLILYKGGEKHASCLLYTSRCG